MDGMLKNYLVKKDFASTNLLPVLDAIGLCYIFALY